MENRIFFMTFALAYYPKTKMEGIEKEAIHPFFFLKSFSHTTSCLVNTILDENVLSQQW